MGDRARPPREGVSILLTTQYLEEADELADRVAVLDAGRIVADGTPDELKRQVPGGHVRVIFDSDERLAAAASALGSPATPNTAPCGSPSTAASRPCAASSIG